MAASKHEFNKQLRSFEVKASVAEKTTMFNTVIEKQFSLSANKNTSSA